VIFNGSPFTCQIDNQGRISDVSYGGFQGSSYDGANTTRARGDDPQWSDERYRSARAQIDTPASASTANEPQPAYPGGPLPGDEAYTDDVDADLGG